MGKKFRTKVAESKAITVLRQQTVQAWNNVTEYVSGGLEQLAIQVGHEQRIQSAIVELLEERTPGTTDRLKAIMEDQAAKHEAEQLARKEAAEKLAAQKEQERAAEAPPADIAPSEVADVAPLPQTD